jgi:hypothetical protein
MRKMIRFKNRKLDVVETLDEAVGYIHREYERDVIKIKDYVNVNLCQRTLVHLGFEYVDTKEGSREYRKFMHHRTELIRREQYMKLMSKYKVSGWILVQKGRFVTINGKPVASRSKGKLMQRIHQAHDLKKYGALDEFTANAISHRDLELRPIFKEIVK